MNPEEQAAVNELTAVPAGAAAPGVAPPPSSSLGPLPPISSSSLGSLPPIDAVTLPSAPLKSRADQAALDSELDALHEQLGVKRGFALAEAMKPKFEVPMPPVQWAVEEPRAPTVPLATASTPAASTAPTNDDEAVPISDALVMPPPSLPPAEPPLLALPAPEDVNSLITLDCSTGQAVTLDHLGPVVVNTDGTLARITNWTQMSEQEQAVTKRRIAKRNIQRLEGFRDRGDLKEDLVGALQSKAKVDA